MTNQNHLQKLWRMRDTNFDLDDVIVNLNKFSQFYIIFYTIFLFKLFSSNSFIGPIKFGTPSCFDTCLFDS